jgi:hypothetical protein
MFTLHTNQFQITFAEGRVVKSVSRGDCNARRKTLKTLVTNYVPEFGLKGRGKGRVVAFYYISKNALFYRHENTTKITINILQVKRTPDRNQLSAAAHMKKF